MTCTEFTKQNILPLSEKAHLQQYIHTNTKYATRVPTTQLAKMSIDPKFIELTADDVLRTIL